jgi:hypothetical protein
VGESRGFVVGLLVFFWCPIVYALVVLARVIWRWYRPAVSTTNLSISAND